MPGFNCPKCGEEMSESMTDHWKCIHHGNFNISYLMGRVHAKHESPFYIILTSEEIDQLSRVQNQDMVRKIVNDAEKQGYIPLRQREDYNL